MDDTGRLIEAGAHPQPLARGEGDPLRDMRTKDLVTELAGKGRLLVRKEIELAKAEIKADVRREIRMAGGLGVAGLCALFTVQLLLVAVVLALMEGGVLPGWAAALVVAAVVLAVGTAAGLWGWAKRVRVPLDTTRRSLKEDVRWAKEQIRVNRAPSNGSPRDGDVGRVAGEIDVLRHELGGLVSELDRRRHEALDVRLQMRRHPVLVAAVATVAALLVGGAIALVVRDARQRRHPTRRAREVRDAFSRLVSNPRQVASQPSISNKVATAVGVAIATTVAKRLLDRAVTPAAKAQRAR